MTAIPALVSGQSAVNVGTATSKCSITFLLRYNENDNVKRKYTLSQYGTGSKSILYMYCCGTMKSHPSTRIILQKRDSVDEISDKWARNLLLRHKQ